MENSDALINEVLASFNLDGLKVSNEAIQIAFMSKSMLEIEFSKALVPKPELEVNTSR